MVGDASGLRQIVSHDHHRDAVSERNDQVFDDPHVTHRGLQADLDGVPTVRPPFRFSDAEVALHRPPPKLDEHGPEIRDEIRAALKRR